LNWALGSLKEMIENKKPSFGEIQNIVAKVKINQSLYLLNKFSERKEMLKKL